MHANRFTISKKVNMINEVKLLFLLYCPFSNDTVDYVVWVKPLDIIANDYNSNTIDPPEKRLLRHSLESDGFTQKKPAKGR